MNAKYQQTFSSGGKVVSTTNQVIDFMKDAAKKKNCNVQYLHLQSFAQAVKFRINDEATIHWVDTDSEVVFSDIDIDKITIVDAGVEFYYTAMSTQL